MASRAPGALLLVGLGALAAACRESPETWIDPKFHLEFVRLPAGEFWMGSPASEVGREPQEVRHRVRLSRPFDLLRHELTQQEWLRVMGTRPSAFADCGELCPVENVSWFDAQALAARLSEATGERFRLPTEAEWEYACRAGTSTPFSTGWNLRTDQANYAGTSPYPGFPAGEDRDRPVRVGSFRPNLWGLHDLHGNVWEWTEDELCPYPTREAVDPIGRCGAELKVIRGGSFAFDAASARSALRYTHRPEDRGFSLGVRLVHEP